MRVTLCALTITLLLWGPQVVHANAVWIDCGTVEPFHVQSNYELNDPDAVLRVVEQLKSDFDRTLALRPSKRPIEIRLFRTKHGYKRHVSKRIPRGERHPALFVKGPDVSWVYIYAQRDFTKNLRHECTHALLHNSLSFLPLWLDEGLAQYMEIPRQKAANGHTHLADVRRSVARGWRPNLAKIEKKSSHQQFEGDDYGESWAWVHFLIHGPRESRLLLHKYLKRIESREFAGRMSAWMNSSPVDFDRQFVAHFRKR